MIHQQVLVENIEMQVKFSRSKLQINKKQIKKVENSTGPAPRCNHCGGAIQLAGEEKACIMCSRVAGHYCQNCQFGHPSEISDQDKKTA